MAKLYELAADNRESHLSLFMNDLVMKWKIDWEGAPNCDFWQRRVKLSQARRKVVDDYFIFRALAFAYQGLTLYV